MNPNTGHLVDFGSFSEALKDLPAQTFNELNYVTLPDDLQHAAKVKLNGANEAYVSLTSGGKLSTWAKNKRKEKHKSKIAAASRRKNRK
jgi:hypothetical protein